MTAEMGAESRGSSARVPPEGRSPADLGKALAEMGVKAKLIDPQPGVVYTLSKCRSRVLLSVM